MKPYKKLKEKNCDKNLLKGQKNIKIKFLLQVAKRPLN